MLPASSARFVGAQGQTADFLRGVRRHQHIHITFYGKIVTQNRTEQRKLHHLLALAKGDNSLLRDGDISGKHE